MFDFARIPVSNAAVAPATAAPSAMAGDAHSPAKPITRASDSLRYFSSEPLPTVATVSAATSSRGLLDWQVLEGADKATLDDGPGSGRAVARDDNRTAVCCTMFGAKASKQAAAPSPSPPARQRAQRRCACGGTPGPDGECAACKAKRLARLRTSSAPPRSRVHAAAEEINAEPRPAPAPAPAAARAPAPSPAPPKCAHPVNWNHSGPTDFGPDAIRIPITWESSTGSLADLGSCTVREVVKYDPIPNPPFDWHPPNPTILTVPAVLGAGQDTHSYPPGLQGGISNPRVAGTAVAHQQYQFRCTGPGCSGNWENFPNQAYTITREVFAQYVRPNPWRYRISKVGVGNVFHYSREVEIPEPVAPAPVPGPTGPSGGAVSPPAAPPGTGAGAGTGSSFQVCSRDLQGALGLVANHAYIEAPPKRYAVIGPLCPAHWYQNPVTGTVAQKWDNSPDPCQKTPRCIGCVPRPGVTNLATCFSAAFAAYSNPSLYLARGPNSNTFAGTLARSCCAGMVPKPAALGNCPGWDDAPAPPRTGASPCPPGPTC